MSNLLPRDFASEPNNDYESENMFEGQGVSPELVHEWKDTQTRFAWSGENRLDFNKFPRPKAVKLFFEGEHDSSEKKGRVNSVNNPLSLYRPATLHSVSSIFYENGQTFDYPKYYEDDRSKRGWDDSKNESAYVEAVKNFEELSITVLESLNIDNVNTRIEIVKAQLESIFRKKDSYKEFLKISPAENAPGWLVYSVISILDNSSDKITPLGRLRALELLQLYSPLELAEGFRSEKYKSKYYNGFDRSHMAKLPHTFSSREERLEDNHIKIWSRNQKINELIIKDSRSRIDWETTAAVLAQNYPEEAIQIALLMLHDSNLSEGGLAFLWTLPQLDKFTLSRMFGKKATFLIEHKLAKGSRIEDLVAKGTGVSINPTRSFEEIISSMTSQEVAQLFRRERELNAHLTEELSRQEVLQAQNSWKIVELQHQIILQQEELAYWKAGIAYTRGAERRSHHQGNVIDQIDPSGFYRILELHPSLFENKTEEEINEMVTRHFRLVSKIYHPDSGGDVEQMKKLNEAKEIMSDPVKRRRYGNE